MSVEFKATALAELEERSIPATRAGGSFGIAFTSLFPPSVWSVCKEPGGTSAGAPGPSLESPVSGVHSMVWLSTHLRASADESP